MARKKQRLSEKSAISIFLETWQRTKSQLPSDVTNEGGIQQYIAKCQARLKAIERERDEAAALAEQWRKDYEVYRNNQIKAGHKVSSYSAWVKIAPGCYGQPKK